MNDFFVGFLVDFIAGEKFFFGENIPLVLQKLKENFGILMTGIVVIVAAGVALTVTKKIYQKNLARSKREEA